MTSIMTTFRGDKVGDIAATLAGATALFRKYKIDFCCGGDVPLLEAALKRGIAIDDLEAGLAALAKIPPVAPQESAELVGHIISRFHETHRRELPELVTLARRVEAVHRDHPQAPHGLADILERASSELAEHMAKEEQVLFPAMQLGFTGSLDMPILVMRHDHNDHAAIIHEIEHVIRGFVVPEDACRTWQALYAGTEKLIADLMEHIHLENNVLFPRFEKRGARAV